MGVKVGVGAALAVFCLLSLLVVARQRPADPARALDCEEGWEARKGEAFRAERARRKHLSEAQRRRLADRETKRQDDWLRTFNRGKIDLRALPRGDNPLIIDYFGPPHRTLQATVDAADLIVVAEVRSVHFHVDNRSYVRQRAVATYSIERLLKGAFPRTLTTPAYFHVRPGETYGEADWDNPSHAVLVADDESPIPVLLPGNRVVLLLEEAEDVGPPYQPISWVGTYQLKDGRVTTIPRNPLWTVTEGQGEEAFIAEVRRLVSR